MTPRAQRLLRLNSHVSPIALTRGVDDHCCIATPHRLPAPNPGFEWRWFGPMPKSLADVGPAALPSRPRSPGWPCRFDEFAQVYAGNLVGFGSRVPNVRLQ